MVTRFAASLPTDNSPQRKEAQPLSHSDIQFIQYVDSSAHGLVRRWLLIGCFPIHLLPRPDMQPPLCRQQHFGWLVSVSGAQRGALASSQHSEPHTDRGNIGVLAGSQCVSLAGAECISGGRVGKGIRCRRCTSSFSANGANTSLRMSPSLFRDLGARFAVACATAAANDSASQAYP
jgi:hypothetical protein